MAKFTNSLTINSELQSMRRKIIRLERLIDKEQSSFEPREKYLVQLKIVHKMYLALGKELTELAEIEESFL